MIEPHAQIAAPADRIYRALTDRDAVQAWLPPEGAKGIVHAFDPRPGGAFRMTLVFDTPGETTAKSSENTDVVEGEFLDLVPNERIRQRFTFQSEDPAFAGAMDMTWTLIPTSRGAQVAVVAENVPAGITPQDHEAGLMSSLANLAKYVE